MRNRSVAGAKSTVKLPVVHQTSAGGVGYKKGKTSILVAIVSVGDKRRWQLPKGLVEKNETPESAAIRETREEAGITGEVESPLERIEYWYVGDHDGKQVRFHKIVHFFLLRYVSGDVADHDFEVNDSRWVTLDEARSMLSFATERKVLRIAAKLLEA